MHVWLAPHGSPVYTVDDPIGNFKLFFFGQVVSKHEIRQRLRIALLVRLRCARILGFVRVQMCRDTWQYGTMLRVFPQINLL